MAGARLRRLDLPLAPPLDAAERRRRSEVGRAVLRDLVAELSGVDPSEVLIAARCPDCGGPHGRPVVMGPDAARDIRVTLAYAGATVVAGARRGSALGVDAEAIGDPSPDDDRRRAARAIAPPAIDDADPVTQWTRIEAVLKADGRGLRVDPADVRFSGESGRLVAVVAGDTRRYTVRDAALGADLVVTVAEEI